MADVELEEAARNKKIVSLTYEKKTTGEIVTHNGGIQEIGTNKAGAEVIWLWDTDLQDNIRQFLTDNILSFEVTDYDYIKMNEFPIKIHGEIVD